MRPQDQISPSSVKAKAFELPVAVLTILVMAWLPSIWPPMASRFQAVWCG